MLDNRFLDFTIFPLISPHDLLNSAKGENKKGLIIIYLAEDDETEHLTLLQNILKAIQYDLNQDALLLSLTAKSRLRFIDILKDVTAKDIIVFGIQAKQLGLNWQHKAYQLVQFDNKRYLFGHPLSEIQHDKQKKGALWQALKGMFLEK